MITLEFSFRLGTSFRDRYVDELLNGKRLSSRWQINGKWENLKTLEKNPFRMIPFLLYINEAILQRRQLREAQLQCHYGIRTFPVIAKKTWSRQHIRYESDTVVLLHNRQIRKIQQGRRDKRETLIPLVLCTTDSYEVFSQMFMAMSSDCDLDLSINGAPVVARAGIDPGRRFMYGVREEKNPKLRTNIMLKSASFHREVGYFARKRKRRVMTAAFEQRTATEREMRQQEAEENGKIYNQRQDLIEHERGYFNEKVYT